MKNASTYRNGRIRRSALGKPAGAPSGAALAAAPTDAGGRHQAPSPESEALAGIVGRITFHIGENRFGVLRVDANRLHIAHKNHGLAAQNTHYLIILMKVAHPTGGTRTIAISMAYAHRIA